MMNSVLIGVAPSTVIVVVAIVSAVLFFGVAVLLPGRQARRHGIQLGIGEAIMMNMAKTPPRLMLSYVIELREAGIDSVSIKDVAGHYLASGRVQSVVNAMCLAKSDGLDVRWNLITAIDLTGRNVVDVVEKAITPAEVWIPNPNFDNPCISAVAQDGIELTMRGLAKVKWCLDDVIGSTTEETFIAQAGVAMIQAVGDSSSHRPFLDNPALVVDKVILANPTEGTALNLVDFQIVDLKRGRDIGAMLQAGKKPDELLNDIAGVNNE